MASIRANRTTVFMACLGAFLAACGLGIVALGVMSASWLGIVIGLSWVAFAGPLSVYAWRTRYER